jgi:protein-tyrosine kinase
VLVGIVERVASRLGEIQPAEKSAAGDGVENASREPDFIERATQTAQRASPVHDNAFTPADSGTAIPLTPVGSRRPTAPSRTAPKIELNFATLRDRNFITPDGERTQVAEGFRRIKRHVLANVLKPRPDAAVNRVMVTSALPSEGKTFCSINLAISLAMELHRSVLLVDADTVKPNVLNSLCVQTALRGLMDLLANPALDPADLICETNIPNLRILPAGTAHRQSTELLASEAMKRLALELAHSSEDRIVIFDSPPLLAASEATALAGHMSQVLMIVAAGQTTEIALKEALHRLEGCDATVGMILNKQPGRSSSYGYGYRYGYGYGTGHGT